MVFIYNGEIIEKELCISPQHRGLRYGDGLFETIKVIDGELQYADKHFERLLYGMQVLQMDFERLRVEKLEKLSQKLIKHTDRKDGIIRINITRKSLAKSKVNYNFDTLIEYLKDETAGKYILNKVGLSIGFYTDYLIQPDVLSNIKSNNRTLYTLAQQSMPLKFDDMLLLNTHNKIADATIYNLFWIKEGKVFTNPATDGGVDGVMRKVIVEKLQGTEYEVTRQSIDRENLLAADEIFLTNVVKGIRWVKSVEGVEKGNEIVKKVYFTVMREE